MTDSLLQAYVSLIPPKMSTKIIHTIPGAPPSQGKTGEQDGQRLERTSSFY